MSLDERTNAGRGKVARAHNGLLKNDQMSSEELFLLSSQEISIVNRTTARVFKGAVQTLWPDGLTFDTVLLLVTDAALYST